MNNWPSRNRTYIGNLEGFCPNPLDDRPLVLYKIIYNSINKSQLLIIISLVNLLLCHIFVYVKCLNNI